MRAEDSHPADPILSVFLDAAFAQQAVDEGAGGFDDEVAGAAVAEPAGEDADGFFPF